MSRKRLGLSLKLVLAVTNLLKEAVGLQIFKIIILKHFLSYYYFLSAVFFKRQCLDIYLFFSFGFWFRGFHWQRGVDVFRTIRYWNNHVQTTASQTQ